LDFAEMRLKRESRMVGGCLKVGLWCGAIILTGDFTVVYRDRVPFGIPTAFCCRAEYKSLFSVTVNSGFMPEGVFARANNVIKN